MSQIPRETVEQVLSATDIVDLIGTYTPVKRAGSRFVALCPFHNEKSPSFSIDPQKQFYHCFGCKKSGDAITFVRDYENLTFIDAVKKLAGRVGVTIVEQAVDPKEERARRVRGRLLDLHREASRFFHKLLMRSPDAAHAREYLKGRGYGKEMAERWEVGWAPASPRTFLDWARKEQLRGRDLVESGLAIKRETGGLYLRFRDRLMFPVRNDHGDVIAFSGRQLREDPRSGKYINSPETSLFKKSRVIFGLDKARKGILDEKAVLICEGQIDAICCQERGVPHAVATLGTACTPEHARILKRYTKQALLCFDADAAGKSAAERAFRECAAVGIGVKVVEMPAGEDPDSFMNSNGTETFRQLLDGAVNFFDFQIEQAKANGDLSGPQERAAFTTKCADLLSAITDDVTRDAMVNHVATRLRTGPPELRAAIREAKRKQSNQKRFARRGEEDDPPPAATIEPARIDRRIGTLCSLALHSNEAREWLADQFETLHELKAQLEGVDILTAIIAGKPDPQSAASINSFLGSLPEPQRLGLQQESAFSESLPENPVGVAEQTLADASALALEKEDAEIKAALNDPNLPLDEQKTLLERVIEIAKLLEGTQSRAITTDRFTPNSRPKKSGKPWNKRDFGNERNS